MAESDPIKAGQAPGSQSGSGETERAAVRQTRSTVRSGGSQYEDTAACAQCYAKHLSKAAVQYAEYLETVGRSHELALCIGNIACAEDHAMALGMMSAKSRLHDLRDRIWTRDGSVLGDLSDLAASAVMLAMGRTGNDTRLVQSAVKKPDPGLSSNGSKTGTGGAVSSEGVGNVGHEGLGDTGGSNG